MPGCVFEEGQGKTYQNPFFIYFMADHARLYLFQFLQISNLFLYLISMLVFPELFDSHFELGVVEDISPVASADGLAF